MSREQLFWCITAAIFAASALALHQASAMDADCKSSCEPYLMKRVWKDCYCSTDAGGWRRPTDMKP